jgi:hypothetical protein
VSFGISMKNLKNLATYKIVDNSKINRFNEIFGIWLLIPAANFLLLFFCGAWVIELTKKTLSLSIFWGIGFLLLMIFANSRLPRNYEIYFYVVCLGPAMLGILLSIASVVVYLLYGYSK